MGLSLRKAAKALDISHVALLKAERTGRVKREADGSFDVEACRAELAKNSNPGKQKSARKQQQPKSESSKREAPPAGKPEDDSEEAGDLKADPPDGNYNDACTRLEWVKVRRAELALAKERGELFPIAEVNAHVAGMIVRAREIFIHINCDERTRREIERALRELSEFVG